MCIFLKRGEINQVIGIGSEKESFRIVELKNL